jgi:hypothetical protein
MEMDCPASLALYAIEAMGNPAKKDRGLSGASGWPRLPAVWFFPYR